MESLLLILIFPLSLIVGYWIYFNSMPFKGMSIITEEELDSFGEFEGNEDEKRFARQFIHQVGFIIFLILATLSCLYLGITVGRYASFITDHYIAKWFVWFLMYVLFLRFPFNILTKMAITKLRLEELLTEKLFFTLIMIFGFFLAIYNFSAIPYIFKWHLLLF